MLPWKLQKSQILPVSQNLSSVYFSLAKFQLVSCNLSLAMIWQMTYTQKLPKLCSATLTLCILGGRLIMGGSKVLQTTIVQGAVLTSLPTLPTTKY